MKSWFQSQVGCETCCSYPLTFAYSLILLLLRSFLPRKGSSLAMLAIGFQHELFQLRLFQWFLGKGLWPSSTLLTSKRMPHSCQPAVAIFSHIRHHPSLDKWRKSKDSWLCHSKWSAGLWKTFHELHKDLPKDTPSNHEVSSRLLWLLPKSCLSKRVRHRQRTLIASALAFSFGLWDYDIWPSAWEWGDNMLWILCIKQN